MTNIAGKIFNKSASASSRKHLETFPLPGAYVRRIFRLDQDDYAPCPSAEKLLMSITGRGLSMMRNRQSWLFQPALDPFVAQARPPHENDPLNIGATGGIACSFYKDIWGRSGLALALMPSSPYKRKAPEENAIFAMNGYLDEKADFFYIHELRYPYFTHDTRRLSELAYDHKKQESDVARTMRFAERAARDIFAGNGDALSHDLYTIWDNTRHQYLPSTPAPWQAKAQP